MNCDRKTDKKQNTNKQTNKLGIEQISNNVMNSHKKRTYNEHHTNLIAPNKTQTNKLGIERISALQCNKTNKQTNKQTM